MKQEVASFLDYVAHSPTVFQATQQACDMLDAAGFTRLSEHEAWEILPGGRYYVTRNRSALVAFAVPTLIVVCIAHYFVQRHYDRKNDDVYSEAAEVKASDAPAAPKWYAIFPVLPIVLLIIFSKLVVTSIKLDTISALFMVWVGVVIVEIIRTKSVLSLIHI